MRADILDSFRMLPSDSVAAEVDGGHGRVETRTCSALGDLSLIEHAADWPRLHSLVRIQAERYHKATRTTEHETRYYIRGLAHARYHEKGCPTRRSVTGGLRC